MAATITRDLSITYGTLTIGGSTEFYVFGGWSHDVDYEGATLSCQVVVQADTESAFQSACDTFEDGIRQIDVDLSLSYGGATAHIDYSHSSNTGMLSRASASVAAGLLQTKLMRVYDVEFSVTLPADEDSAGGLRSHSVEITRNGNGLAMVVVSGEYTATGDQSASANFANVTTGGEAVTAAISGALSGTFESVSNLHTYDRRNKVLSFRIVHAEIGYRQSTASTDIPAIKNQRISVTREVSAPGDLSDARRLIQLAVSFSCEVDKSVTTGLQSLWDGTIRTNVIDTVRTIAGTTVALIDEAPLFDLGNNSVRASLMFLARGESSVLRHEITTTIDESASERYVPLHDGDPFSRALFFGDGQILRITDETKLTFAGGVGGTGGVGGFAGQNTFGIGAVTPTGLAAGGTGSGQVGTSGAFSGSVFGGAGIVGQGFQAGAEVQRPGSGQAQQSTPTPSGFVTIRNIETTKDLFVGQPDAGFNTTLTLSTRIETFVKVRSGGGGGSGGSRSSASDTGSQPVTPGGRTVSRNG